MFDVLWTLNFKTSAFKDKAAIFGTADSKCICYNPISRLELTALLTEHDLIGSLNKSPHYNILPELLNKLYNEMGRANESMHLSASKKKQMLGAEWHKTIADVMVVNSQ